MPSAWRRRARQQPHPDHNRGSSFLSLNFDEKQRIKLWHGLPLFVHAAAGRCDDAVVNIEALMLERAIHVACRAHRGQLYPSPEGEPFILHPLRVMLAVSGARTQMAAVLHDVLEDSPLTADELRAEDLPGDVVDAVVALTHRAGSSYEGYIEQVALNSIARKVKVADIADNLANNRRLPGNADVMARIARYERALLRLGDVAPVQIHEGSREDPR